MRQPLAADSLFRGRAAVIVELAPGQWAMMRMNQAEYGIDYRRDVIDRYWDGAVLAPLQEWLGPAKITVWVRGEAIWVDVDRPAWADDVPAGELEAAPPDPLAQDMLPLPGGPPQGGQS